MASMAVRSAALLLATLAPGSVAEMQVKVFGHSGKFEFYNDGVGAGAGETNSSKASGGEESDGRLRVTMDALKEVSADGAEVGKGGQERHSVHSFASTDFVIGETERNVSIGTARATRVAFSATVSTGRVVQIETYLVTEPGVVGMGEDQWNVSAGALKWNIVFPEWDFCGCSKGNKEEVGAFLDLTITVQGLGEVKQSKSSDMGVDLGDGMCMELSKFVELDGQVSSMPSGYPKIEYQGSKMQITFRFPKFETRAVYDPVMYLLSQLIGEEAMLEDLIQDDIQHSEAGGSGGSGGSGGNGGNESDNESSPSAVSSALIDGSPRRGVPLMSILALMRFLLLN